MTHTAVGPFACMSDACAAAKSDPISRIFGGYIVTVDAQTGAFDYHYRGSVLLASTERTVLDMEWDADRFTIAPCGGF